MVKRLSDVNQNNNKITGLPTPVNDSDAATKKYVDDNAGGGSGDVEGPDSSTDNAIARFDSTTGKVIQDSTVIIADTTGSITFNGTSPSINSAAGLFTLNTASVQVNASSGGVSLTGNMGVYVSSDLYVDKLVENTTDAGVTIDGVPIKDGEVDGRDVSADGSKLDGIESGADVTDAANVSSSGGLIYVNHGATAGTSRPSVSGAVIWVGSVEPTNATNGDIWYDIS